MPWYIQLFSKKCTGRYDKVRDDDLSSKQGSLCTFKMILVIRKYFIVYIYINIVIFVIRLKHNIFFFMNFFVNSIDK